MFKNKKQLGVIAPDPTDIRDYQLAEIQSKRVELPDEFDLRDKMTPVGDQNYGSCTSWSGCAVKEYWDKKEYGRDIDLSEKFNYYNIKKISGLWEIEGDYLRNSFKALCQYGAPLLEDYPDTRDGSWENYLSEPPQELYEKAKKYKGKTYWSIDRNLESFRQAIFQNNCPIGTGMKWFRAYYNERSDGYLPRPAGDKVGGHAIACVPKDTKVKTKKGISEIQNISKGEYVLTHKGNWKKVKETIKRKVNKDERVYSISTPISVKPLTVTEEHPLYVRKSDIRKDKIVDYISRGTVLRRFEFMPAADVNLEDYIAIPIETDEEKVEICGKEINKNLARLIGYYIGDGNIVLRFSQNGNIKSGKVRFTYEKGDPKKVIEDLKGIMREEFDKEHFNDYESPKSSNREHQKQITWFSTEIAKFLAISGGTAKNKELASVLLSKLKPELQREIIYGWAQTDGYYTGDDYNIFTSEEELALQLQELIHRCRLRYSIYQKPAGCAKIRERKYWTKGGYSFQICNVNKDLSKQSSQTGIVSYYKNYLFARVNKIKIVDDIDEVYNLEVEDDNSYTADKLAVHNCAGWTKDAKLWFKNSWGTDYGKDGYFYIPFEEFTKHDFWNAWIMLDEVAPKPQVVEGWVADAWLKSEFTKGELAYPTYRLNFRTSPWGRVIKTLKEGEEVKILGESKKDERGLTWQKIELVKK